MSHKMTKDENTSKSILDLVLAILRFSFCVYACMVLNKSYILF